MPIPAYMKGRLLMVVAADRAGAFADSANGGVTTGPLNSGSDSSITWSIGPSG
ncbi:MAG: hypothetical protein KDI62_20615 [Anaerolineae bacterium]|nr:hypothetical protein [Anaerolineae bacterium]